MALQICPNCRAEQFTWSIDEEESPLTKWACGHCGYQAYEDESFERVCNDCGKKVELKLDDGQKEYWWCCRCNKTTLITDNK